ncbi:MULTISPECIES: exonuclease subunit SbcD [Pseudoalteromonas]|uniref:exonuclease subunit SbcD n=1 Tax=Pseudoalteromonas TaxID=53246 RepID=UPI00026CD253|nr:exonuclease subunit SbcD [Pseudoalteromonas spongiae]ATC97556.1 exonuclease SbcD [Pseudoalteromonas spongiae UST010723-006]
MRIIHTSDWHLGQSFFNQSRQKEHHLLIKWLAEQVKAQQVDAVIIAGDIFDTGTPPSYARSLYSELILAMQAADCQLIVTAGNHDSVATLNEIKSLVKALNCHVVSQASENVAEQIVAITKAEKTLGYVCAIPFLRSKDIITSHADESIKEKQDNLAKGIYEHFENTFKAAQTLKADQDIPIIMTGHLTAVGASSSESVRDIYIGHLSGINAHQLPNADYIALGHIHGAQKVGKEGNVFYSGSPIALSFDELKHAKSVNLVEFEGQNVSQINKLEIPRFQAMQAIKGNLAEIKNALTVFAEQTETTWLSIEVTTDDYISDLQNTVLDLTKDLPVEVLQLKRARKHVAKLSQQKQENLSEITPLEVFEKRISLEEFTTEDDLARKERLTQHFISLLNTAKGAQS